MNNIEKSKQEKKTIGENIRDFAKKKCNGAFSVLYTEDVEDVSLTCVTEGNGISLAEAIYKTMTMDENTANLLCEVVKVYLIHGREKNRKADC